MHELWTRINEINSQYKHERSASDKCESVIELEEEGLLHSSDESDNESDDESNGTPIRDKFIRNQKPLTDFPMEAVNALPGEKQDILIEYADEIFNDKITYQEQIELVVSLIYDPIRKNKSGASAISKLFSISRGAMFSHIKRMERGHKEVGRAPILDSAHMELLHHHIRKKLSKSASPDIPTLCDWIYKKIHDINFS